MVTSILFRVYHLSSRMMISRDNLYPNGRRKKDVDIRTQGARWREIFDCSLHSAWLAIDDTPFCRLAQTRSGAWRHAEREMSKIYEIRQRDGLSFLKDACPIKPPSILVFTFACDWWLFIQHHVVKLVHGRNKKKKTIKKKAKDAGNMTCLLPRFIRVSTRRHIIIHPKVDIDYDFLGLEREKKKKKLSFFCWCRVRVAWNSPRAAGQERPIHKTATRGVFVLVMCDFDFAFFFF